MGDTLEGWVSKGKGGVGEGLSRAKGRVEGRLMGVARVRGCLSGSGCGLVWVMKLSISGHDCQFAPLGADEKPIQILQPECLEPNASMCLGCSCCLLGNVCSCRNTVTSIIA